MWKWPRNLLSTDPKQDKLIIPEDTLEAIREIKQNMVVVGIAGLYRTGKSYIMNLLAGSSSGFDLGSTIQSQTKGIWIWCVPHPEEKDLCLALLVTEGLGDVEKGDSNNDALIFVITTLLSSTLIYNTMGTIDQKAIENIQFITKISELVKLSSGSEEAEEENEDEDDNDGDETNDLSDIFPIFIWIVRDAILQLKKNGKDISEDEYLEFALELKKGCGEKISRFNLPRECIREFFPTRKCFVFPRPVEQSELLTELDKLSTEQLNPAFTKKADIFASYVYNNSKVKSVNGQQLNGPMLAEVVKCYVQSINNGDVIRVQSAFETMSHILNAKAVEETTIFYKTEFEKQVQLPTETVDQLNFVHRHCEEEACQYFLQHARFDDERKFYLQMMEKLTEIYAMFCKKNIEASNDVCTALIDSLYSPIEQKLATGEYSVTGGYELFKNDLKIITDRYNETPGKGFMAKEALCDFQAKIESIGKSLLYADKSISEQARKAEDESRKKEMMEKQLEMEKEQRIKTEKRQEDMRKSQEKHFERLLDQSNKDRMALKRDIEEMLNNRLMEKYTLRQQVIKSENDSNDGVLTFVGKALDRVGSIIPFFGRIFGK